MFIDFDNVEIGVKSTIGGQFDIGLVLEAIKERGEIVTKIAYSDWKRAGDYSRVLTQHAIRMVQRNLTPGGDKNGADITMALDALEMAFTHDHINAFVIVGGDSDFISLVEKLKQYGRKVIVVGGRQFTSTTMQKNCHEFIAYENLTSSRGRTEPNAASRQPPRRSRQALPLVKRALKVLSEREVTPQLGLLKSTLLQLDSTFSERDYGASSFRDFMEKVAQTGAVTLEARGPQHARRVEGGRSIGRRSRRRHLGKGRALTTHRFAGGPCRSARFGADGRCRRGRDAATFADEPAGRHPRRAAGVHPVCHAPSMAHVCSSGKAVPAKRDRGLRRAQVRVRVGCRSPARCRQRRCRANRARSSGRSARFSRERISNRRPNPRRATLQRRSKARLMSTSTKRRSLLRSRLTGAYQNPSLRSRFPSRPSWMPKRLSGTMRSRRTMLTVIASTLLSPTP